MKLEVSLIIIICTLVTVKCSNGADDLYEGYKVYEIVPKTRNELKMLHEIIDDLDNVQETDIWKWSRKIEDPLHVMVAPSYQQSFEQLFVDRKIRATPFINNLATTYRDEIKSNIFRTNLNQDYDFKTFLQYDEILKYLDAMQSKYPKKVKVDEVGNSFEGRSMKTIRISSNLNSRVEKKTIFVDAGIHAREWIAPATALYIVDQLLNNEADNYDLLQRYDWIILPTVNPDGYQYSHEKDRMWRKTRKPGAQCIGTDGNRNFKFHWGEVGASEFECTETYRGSNSFSEPETTIVKQILESVGENCKFYLTLHSYGNYLLYPWGYTDDLPDNWEDLDEVCRAGADAMKKSTGATYTVGSSTNVLYAAAGGSDDYALGVIGVPISVTMELSGGRWGFVLPSDQIERVVRESWIGIAAMARKVISKY